MRSLVVRRNTMSLRLFSLCVFGLLTLGGCGSLPQLSLEAESAKTDQPSQPAQHFAEGRYGLALDGFKKMLNEEPSSQDALNGLAASYAMLGRKDVAERLYHRALNAAPNDWRTLNNIGFFYLSYRKPDVAMAYLAEADAIAGNKQVVTANLAHAEQELGRGEDNKSNPRAISALARKPDDGEIEGLSHPVIERVNGRIQKLRSRPQFAYLPSDPALTPQHLRSRRNETPPSAMPPQPEARPALTEARIEISNGAGMRHMASLVRGYLIERGIASAKVSNADHFRHQTSTIYYRAGHKRAAARLAATLPETVPLVIDQEQAADVRLELGGDLLAFARELHIETKQETPDHA
jgi:tetratricopeptide (TPR) repeat protein